MVVDALLAADPILRISDQITDPNRYVFLTDSIIEEIERSFHPVSSSYLIHAIIEAIHQELAASREIIERLRRRRLYKCVDVIHLHAHEEEHWRKFVTCESIVKEANKIRSEDSETSNQPPVLASDSKAHRLTYNQSFYGKHNPNVAMHAKPEVYSQTFPHYFAELALRVNFDSLYGLVQAGFRSVQHTCLQKVISKGSTQKSTLQTPRQGFTALPENVDGSGGSEFRVGLYDSNPFTSVPPSFAATGSPSSKSKQIRGRSIASLPSSRASPIPAGDVLPLVTASSGIEQSHTNKRSREIETDAEDISKVLNVSKKPKLK
ncbi:12239_t:CDS:2 [Acaulospora colombiana]|uniref:12239_t:CDS:1 n=1 Tax=Acaulospora colombiana TaxID=27376 RepID=A0ACA9M1E3_9GLOM|nr:12239_t:CDS:2 [Acaulospora colombiana]